MGNALDIDFAIISSSVHPHVHGERATIEIDYATIGGSSPRTWGTHPDRNGPGHRARFIPTYMGNAV